VNSKEPSSLHELTINEQTKTNRLNTPITDNMTSDSFCIIRPLHRFSCCRPSTFGIRSTASSRIFLESRARRCDRRWNWKWKKNRTKIWIKNGTRQTLNRHQIRTLAFAEQNVRQQPRQFTCLFMTSFVVPQASDARRISFKIDTNRKTINMFAMALK
jgi:hypothetical protein